MIPRIRQTYRNLVRVKEILQVLTKHGFGHVIARLNLSVYIPGLKYLGISVEPPAVLSEESIAARLRMVLQELGPAFVKFGQILSGRPDIFPETVIGELKVLQDHVAPFPVEQALDIVARELAAPVTEIFPKFEKEVLASGSIGQVHGAQLADGTEVIVKVKRPEIDALITTDMSILRFLAELMETYIEEIRIFQPVMIVEEFDRTIRRELDFTAEASYTEQFHLLLRGNKNVGSPRVFWTHTTPNLITLEKLNGISIGEVESLRQQGLDLNKIADNLASTFMQQYFVWGFFHADPHPGNILVSSTGKIHLVDFGMVGHLSNELKNQLSSTLLALMRNDIEMIVEIYADIGALPVNINRRELKTDILEMLDKYLHIPFQHLDMASIFENIVRLARNHNVMLPRDFVLLAKSLVTATGIAQELNPDFNFMKAIAPNVTAVLREKLSPRQLLQTAIFQSWSISSLIQKLPADIKDLIRLLKTGNLRFTLQHESLERALSEFKQTGNRLSASIVLSSLVIASSLLTMAQVGPVLHNVPVLGFMGYLLASLFILFLILTNFRR